MSESSPARAYTTGTLISMALYAAAITAASLARRNGASMEVMIPLAVLPGLAIIGQLWATVRYMATADEFMRALLAKRFVIAATLVFAAATVWGFLQEYADFPRPPLYYVYVAFWATYGLISPFVRTSR